MHFLQRNFLSNVRWVDEYVYALESKRCNHPRKTLSRKVTWLSYNNHHSPQKMPSEIRCEFFFFIVLNNYHGSFPSLVWIIKNWWHNECLCVCVVGSGDWLAREILQVFCTRYCSWEKLRLIGNWLIIEVWSVRGAGKKWALLWHLNPISQWCHLERVRKKCLKRLL